jgi:hypothetical protein
MPITVLTYPVKVTSEARALAILQVNAQAESEEPVMYM